MFLFVLALWHSIWRMMCRTEWRRSHWERCRLSLDLFWRVLYGGIMSAVAGLAVLLFGTILSEVIVAETIPTQLVFDNDFISTLWWLLLVFGTNCQKMVDYCKVLPAILWYRKFEHEVQKLLKGTKWRWFNCCCEPMISPFQQNVVRHFLFRFFKQCGALKVCLKAKVFKFWIQCFVKFENATNNLLLFGTVACHDSGWFMKTLTTTLESPKWFIGSIRAVSLKAGLQEYDSMTCFVFPETKFGVTWSVVYQLYQY